MISAEVDWSRSTAGRFHFRKSVKKGIECCFCKFLYHNLFLSPVFDDTETEVVPIPFTVNSDIFARVSLSRNFAYAKFRANKTLEKWRNYSVVYRYM